MREGETPRRRRTKRSKGRTAYRKGKIGETKVKKFLRRRGMKPITSRMRTTSGEHDLIVQTRSGKASVEVKNLKNPVSASMVEKFARKVKKDKNIVKRGIFVSKSGYTPEAKKAARKGHLKLMDYKPPKRKKSGWLF